MEQSKLLFYRVDEVYFKLHQTTKANVKYQILPKFECKMSKNQNTLTAIMSVKINEDISRNPTPFDLSLTMMGQFYLNDEAKDNKREQIIFAVNALFPYMRSFVSTLTVNCNLPPCMLPMLDAEALANNMHDEPNAIKIDNSELN